MPITSLLKHGPHAALILFLLSAIRYGRLIVILPGGGTRSFGQSDADEAPITFTIHNNRAFRRFWQEGIYGFCEAYIDGDWDCSDTPGLFTLIVNHGRMRRARFKTMIWYHLLHKKIPENRRDATKKNCAGAKLTNAFYAQWLGPDMNYTGGMFANFEETLEEAHIHTFESLCTRLDIGPQHRVLEIGCQWGAFAEYVARHHGARILSITTSPTQYAYARNRIESAGLSDRVEVQLIDWRDVQGQFDRIISIDKMSKIGEPHWRAFFKTIHDRLVPGGRAEIQTGVIGDEMYPAHRHCRNFLQDHIFPNCKIITRKIMSEDIEHAGLMDLGHITFGQGYGRTFHIWRQRFHEAWPQIEMLGFEANTLRCWDMFMMYCEAGFRAGTLDVVQKSIAKPHAHTPLRS